MPMPAVLIAKLKAVGLHFISSMLVALLAALVIFGVWYPYPFREISGGLTLFLIITGVDVVMGPLITLVIFSPNKSFTTLRRDLSIVVVLQLAALGYGLWTLAVARPVHMVFELDRFRVVHAVDVPAELLSKVPPNIEALPFTGPTMLGLREFKNAQESMEATLTAVQGLPLGARPELWQSYDSSRAQVTKAGLSIDKLKTRFPQHSAKIDAITAGNTAVAYLPVFGRKGIWTAIISTSNGDILGYLPLDPY